MSNEQKINTRLDRIEDEVKAIRDEMNGDEYIPKVGDWVVILTTDNLANDEIFVGDIGRLTEELEFDSFRFTVEGKDNVGNWVAANEIRRATPQEILKAKGIEEGKWCVSGGEVRKLYRKNLVSYELACEIRLATEEEILNEIAKFEVGDEVWSTLFNQFCTIDVRYLHEGKVWYIGVGDSKCPCHTEGGFEKRPPQKFKVGDKVRNTICGTVFKVDHIAWENDEWQYRDPDGIGRSRESVVEIYVEPKAGEVWLTVGGNTCLILPEDKMVYFPNEVGERFGLGLEPASSYVAKYLGKFSDLYHTLPEINEAYSKAAPLGSPLHKEFIHELTKGK